jgi:hypothetical protein
MAFVFIATRDFSKSKFFYECDICHQPCRSIELPPQQNGTIIIVCDACQAKYQLSLDLPIIDWGVLKDNYH